MIKAFEKHGLIIQGWVAIERNPTIEGQRVGLRLAPNPTYRTVKPSLVYFATKSNIPSDFRYKKREGFWPSLFVER
jgi:hypothetical protein